MKRLSSSSIVLFLILVVSSFLRLYKLDSVPPSLYWEEVALGYDAYSIAKTGKDHHGNTLPVLAFPSFGDYKPSGYFYALVPFVSTLGLNAWSVRLPSAIAGVVSMYLVYLITKELFTKKSAILAAFLFGIQPWAIQFSRGGWEVNLALTFILGGAYFLLKARKTAPYLLLSALCLGVSMYIYHAARLFAPLVGAMGGSIVFTQYWKEKLLPRFWLSALLSSIVAVALIGPFILNLNNSVVSSRFTQTSIFSDIDPILKSNAAIEAHGNSTLSRVLFHRYRFFAEVFLGQMLSHFSVPFLFLRGDGNLRHGIGNGGLLYPIESIGIVGAILIGSLKLVRALRSKKEKTTQDDRMAQQKLVSTKVIVGWIALAAVAPALVTPSPHALRFLIAAPAFSILSSLGYLSIFGRTSKRLQKIILLCLIGGYFFYGARFLSWSQLAYPVISANDWQFGYKELFSTLEKQKRDGEQVYVSRYQGRPSMYYLFFSNYDPKAVQHIESDLPKDQLELLQVGDYHFIDAVGSTTGIYATSPDAVPPQAEVTAFIRRPDMTTVWVIWRQ